MKNKKGDEKKPKKSWFWRKEKDFDESEDIYYGIEAKPLSELRRGFDITGELNLEEESFKKLFDDNHIDEESEQNYNRIREERRRRVETAAETSGVDVNEVAEEFGVAAPMPVTSLNADPYVKTHGLGETADDSDFQKAMMQTAEAQTMEIKLNVLNDTIELNKNVNIQKEDEQTVNEILNSKASNTVNEDDEDVDFVLKPISNTSEIDITVADDVTDENKEKVEEAEQSVSEQAVVEEAVETEEIVTESASAETTEDLMNALDKLIEKADTDKQDETENVETSEEVAEEKTEEAPTETTVEAEEPPTENIDETDETPVVTQSNDDVEEAENEETASIEKSEDEIDTEKVDEPKKPKKKKKKHNIHDTMLDLNIKADSSKKLEELEDTTTYRDKTLPLHTIKIGVLQNAISKEALGFRKKRIIPQTAEVNLPVDETVKQEEQKQEEVVRELSPEEQEAKEQLKIIKDNMRNVSIKFMASGAVALLMFVYSLAMNVTFTPEAPADLNISVYLGASLLALIAVCALMYKDLFKGFKRLLEFKPNRESAMAVASVAVILQVVLGFFYTDLIRVGTVEIYAFLIYFSVFINQTGKLIGLRRVYNNFRFIASREQKYSVNIYDDYDNSLKFAKDTVAGKPYIAYQKKTASLKNFFNNSVKTGKIESSWQSLTPISFALSLLLCLIILIMFKSVYVAVSILAASLCMTMVIGNVIAVKLPLSKLSKRVRRAGAMVANYDAVHDMANVNAVMVDAEELFPSGTVVLEGIKTYGKGNRNLQMRLAAALLAEVGGTLSDIISQINNEDDSDLPKAFNVEYKNENGVIGIVDNRTVFVGNRNLMLNHGVDVPEVEDIAKYTADGRKIIFIAIDEKLKAMLIVSYKADKRKKIEVKKIEEHGVALIVRSTDPNIDVDMISKTFGISEYSINVITGELGEEYASLIKEESEHTSSLVATKGRVESLMTAVYACLVHKKMLNLAVIIQAVSIVTGFILVLLLSVLGRFDLITAVNILLYHLVFLAIATLIPGIRK